MGTETNANSNLAGDQTLNMIRDKRPRPASSDPSRNYLFRIFFPSQDSLDASGNVATLPQTFLAARKVNNLRRPTDTIVHRDGRDWESERKLPGHTRNEPITIEQAYVPGLENDEVLDWAASVHINDSPTNRIKQNFRRTIVVEQLDAVDVNQPIFRWTFYNAWVSELAWGDFDSLGNDVHVRTMTVQHEGMDYEKVKPPKK